MVMDGFCSKWQKEGGPQSGTKGMLSDAKITQDFIYMVLSAQKKKYRIQQEKSQGECFGQKTTLGLYF